MINYWDKYYSSCLIRHASKFAKFCVKYFKPKSFILDLGCGNGEDSVFFMKKSFQVLGVDRANIKANKFPFLRTNFVHLPNFKVDNVYMRFSLHSICKNEEIKLLKWIRHNMEDGVLCIEVRSVNDDLYGKGKKVGKNAFVFSHYRRFINKKELEFSLKHIGFTIVYSKEARNFAPFRGANPKIIRIIAKNG